MKKILFLVPLAFLLVAIGCKKIDQLLTFYIEDTQNIRVAGNSVVGLIPIAPVAVTTRSEEKFKNEDTRADLVKDVSLNKLTLTITDPNNENFDFLESVTLYISTEQSDRVALASLSSVPTGQKVIELKPSGAKLDKYLKASSYTLTTEARVKRAVSQDITMRADSRFKVTADPL
ncbi:hypothetical protein SAMN00120144_2359 [Hymenobacter roseosalivarius DSM 11622]|uniref:Uncharacterized protein n=1 Tax=Hymenobacter roseosalivarius DSM 11622 TaxID=645990 RepID=A0A1W1VLN4_9BACT|nr:hypothetical protein [Hymenobacter roseosalivarius]SMB94238.1 hypothetical protein SAMN00120144_2359 [Hymenobacter roseosalivarius DSM 11622]